MLAKKGARMEMTLAELIAGSPGGVAALIVYFHLAIRPWLKRHLATRDQLDADRNELLVQIRDGKGKAAGRAAAATR